MARVLAGEQAAGWVCADAAGVYRLDPAGGDAGAPHAVWAQVG